MATTVDQVKSVATEFASTDDAVIETFIDEAFNYVSSSFWGESKFNFIHALMTAHLMKQLGAGGAGAGGGGPISSERLGDISVSYASSSVQSDTLMTTSYGQMISQLAKSILKTPLGY